MACSNGYSALVVALKAARIEPNSFVLIPSGTMVAVANAVIDVKCVPIVVDNSTKFTINPSVDQFWRLIQAVTTA